jgi:hypothetical protein
MAKFNIPVKKNNEYVIYRKPTTDFRTIVRKPAFNFNQRDMNPEIEDYVTKKYKQ